MARNVEIDVGVMLDDLKRWGLDAEQVVKKNVQDIMDHWQRESVDLAPIDTSTLRRSIHTKTTTSGASKVDVTGEIRASAVEISPSGRFDYSYWIHEVKGDSFRGRVAGTIGRFLDVPAEENERRWLRQVEEGLKNAARGHGF